MFGVLGLLARLVDDGPVGRHVVFSTHFVSSDISYLKAHS